MFPKPNFIQSFSLESVWEWNGRALSGGEERRILDLIGSLFLAER
jgi:ABC-type lipopolysaccharide export system ATPase subunit